MKNFFINFYSFIMNIIPINHIKKYEILYINIIISIIFEIITTFLQEIDYTPNLANMILLFNIETQDILNIIIDYNNYEVNTSDLHEQLRRSYLNNFPDLIKKITKSKFD